MAQLLILFIKKNKFHVDLEERRSRKISLLIGDGYSGFVQFHRWNFLFGVTCGCGCSCSYLYVLAYLSLDHHTFMWIFCAGGNLFGFGAHSLATAAPVSGSFTATLVLWHGANLCTRSSIQAGLPAAYIIGSTLQSVLTFLTGSVPELRFTTKSTRALPVIYPAAVLRLVEFACSA